MKEFNTVIIGGGIGGLMSAYKLVEEGIKDVLLVDSGNDLDKRNCPAKGGKACVHCKTCSITNGLAGAGAFSDGKFNLGTSYGGTLGEELGEVAAMSYIEKLDSILNEFSEDYPDIYYSNEDLRKVCIQNGLQLLDMNVRHLGTDKNYATMYNIIKHLKTNITVMPNTTCTSITRYQGELFDVSLSNKEDFTVMCKNIIIATGRSGAEFVNNICNKFGINVSSNHVDIGVRVEMPDLVWKHFSEKIYEPKIIYRTKTFGDRCRMFCFNQGGIVSAENNHGIITANGHSYADKSKKTDNCNFAILSSIHFTEPFNKPTEYAENISKLANMIGDGNVIVQRFGDLIRGRRTNEHRLGQSTVIPTLKATPGDLSLVLPHRILTNIIETLQALDKVAPGCANDDTLLYGCESKYYSIKPKHDHDFMIANNMYLIGDGSGICRGLSQSGAMGLYVADRIINKEK